MTYGFIGISVVCANLLSAYADSAKISPWVEQFKHWRVVRCDCQVSVEDKVWMSDPRYERIVIRRSRSGVLRIDMFNDENRCVETLVWRQNRCEAYLYREKIKKSYTNSSPLFFKSLAETPNMFAILGGAAVQENEVINSNTASNNTQRLVLNCNGQVYLDAVLIISNDTGLPSEASWKGLHGSTSRLRVKKYSNEEIDDSRLIEVSTDESWRSLEL